MQRNHSQTHAKEEFQQGASRRSVAILVLFNVLIVGSLIYIVADKVVG
jgi:hypothetical protein